MIITKIVKGHPKEVKEKRTLRIKEAINFPLGTKENPTHNIISKIGKTEVYFNKPGKEYFREGKTQNINDMTPGVGDYYDKYSFGDIWKDLLNISVCLSEDSLKKLFVIIYRLAYLLDCKEVDGKVRFEPCTEIMDEINNIQKEINKANKDFKVLEFLNFIDILGWNEDVKYQADLSFKPPRKGRINNILTMISIPLMYKNFVNMVIENKNNLENVDYSTLIDIAQDFARTRGVAPISNVKLVEHLSPFLIDEK